jgi:type IV pilus assembly protein PilY1
MNQPRLKLIAVAAAAVCGAQGVSAQTVISDKLTGASSQYNWLALNGACLTAGGSTTVTHNFDSNGNYLASTSNPIPACSGLSYYNNKTLVGGYSGTIPDQAGQGALRLTNGDTSAGTNGNNQTGAVISNFTFPSTSGINVTFTTTTYGGNAYTNSKGVKSGADGISFFLLDASVANIPSTNPASMLGAFGGSLGYSCANGKNPADGILGGYLGIGIDEFGNFVTGPGDSTATTAPAKWGSSIANANTSAGQQPGNISVRGAGNVNWATLQSHPYYKNVSSSSSASAIQSTCKSGYLYNFSGGTITDANGNKIKDQNQTTETVMDYPLLGSSLLPSGQTIFGQEATSTPTRSAATPITYQLNITQNGRLTVQYSYNNQPAQTVISNQPITASNGALPTNLRFGFAASTGGGSNVHEITCFKAQPSTISSTSAGSNTQQSKPISGGAQAYLALANPLGYWGQLTANTLSVDSSGNPSIAATANWDAACVLTGTPLFAATGGTGTNRTCPATGQALSAAEAVASTGASGASGTGGRNLITWSGSAGTPLTWASSGPASGSPLLALTAGDATPLTGNRLNYLRGDRTNEITTSNPGNPFRRRISVLGDILNSSPTWVGPPAASAFYGVKWIDKLSSTAVPVENSDANGGYKGFASTNATRTNVVYAGANDGFVHAFRAGSFDSSGNWASTPNGTGTGAANDGYELLAYMPSSALATIHGNTDNTNNSSSNINTSLDFSSPSYQHSYFVDATPGTNDLYYNGAWHTWLVGGMGAGGNYGGAVNNNSANNNSITATPATTSPVAPALGPGAGGGIYALDITNPGNFSEGSASSLVIGDWNAGNLQCAAVSGSRTSIANCGQNLGNTFGTPVIRRLHDGNWAVIFGNGLNSSTGAAGIYVMTVKSSSTGTAPPSTTFTFLDTGTGTSSAKNGIVQVTAADLDGDAITDYVYAGDLQGNVWRFDLTGSSASSWTAATPTTLFTTPAGQPITTALGVTTVASATGNPRIVVNFGTGQQFPMTTANGAVTYASTQQALYGIWDWNLSAWNAKGSSQYAVASGSPSITTANLQSQTMGTGTALSDGTATRTVSQSAVCWAGTTTCTGGASANTQYGWKINLSSQTTGSGSTAVTNYEQVVYNPQINFGDFIVNTTIPGAGSVLSCTTQPITGFTMALTPDAGAAPVTSFFTGTNVNIAGIAIGAVGTAFFVTDKNGRSYIVNQTAVPNPNTNQFGDIRRVYPLSGYTGKRLNWIKER